MGLVATAYAAPEAFPRPAGLETQVRFWKKVFAEYSENQIVIHDSLYIDKVYTVIDLRPLAENGAGEENLRRTRNRKTKAEKARIDAVLQSLHAKRANPQSLTPQQRVIWELFRDVNDSNRFRAARERVRAQQGLRERFRRGIEVSRRYLPHMEAIFRREGLPLELTRLPFVESSFNVKAYSKVGAAGIWQFIPSSARIYRLPMNEVIDARRDPLYATEGAARHLRDDYQTLRSWPLAITAYNHGRAGIARAVRQLGSSDLATVIRRYKGRAFGFASRNFYAEFLAALEVEREYEKHFGPLRFEPEIRFDEVRVDDYVPFSALARLADCDTSLLHDLNPGFEPEVVEGKLHVPRGHRLRVPGGRAEAFRAAYAKLPAGERFASQKRYFVQHRVARGQTLGAIARRYGTTVAAIQVANNLRSPRLIRAGQILKIPSG